MEYAADFQYFKQPGGDIVLKELAFIPLDCDSEPIVLLFKSPYPWSRLNEKYKRENSILKSKIHGISWDSGYIEYNQVGYYIRDTLKDADKVYVIDNCKKEYFDRFKLNVIDITDLGYQTIDVAKVVHFCSNHDFKCKTCCAAQTVKLMKKFLQAQKEWEDISMEWEYS